MKCRIAFVDHTSKIGGAEVSLINLLKKLDRNKYEPYLICPGQDSLSEKVSELNIPIIFFNVERYQKDNKIEYLKSSIKLAGILKKNKIKLIHSNSYLAGEGVFLAARLCNIKSVCHVRDFIPESWFGRAHKFMLGSNKPVIAISQAVKEHLIRNGIDKERISMIYNGVNLELFDRRKVMPHPLITVKKGIVNIGIVGQVIQWKGHEEFIKAAGIVIRKYKNVHFYIVGDAIFNDRSYIDLLKEEVNKKGLQEYVSFTGFIDDVPQVMKSFDILVSASRGEPFGRVIAEAMAMGIPVVATNSGGAPELVKENETGLLFEEMNPESLASKLEALIQDEEKRVIFGENGYIRARELFKIENHAQRVMELYSNLLNQ